MQRSGRRGDGTSREAMRVFVDVALQIGLFDFRLLREESSEVRFLFEFFLILTEEDSIEQMKIFRCCSRTGVLGLSTPMFRSTELFFPFLACPIPALFQFTAHFIVGTEQSMVRSTTDVSHVDLLPSPRPIGERQRFENGAVVVEGRSLAETRRDDRVTIRREMHVVERMTTTHGSDRLSRGTTVRSSFHSFLKARRIDVDRCG